MIADSTRGKRLSQPASLRGLARRIGSAPDDSDLAGEVLQWLIQVFHAANSRIYLRPEFEAKFALRAAVPPATAAETREFQENSPVILFLQKQERSLSFDEAADSAFGEQLHQLDGFPRGQSWQVLIPVIGDTIFYGFIALGSRGDSLNYDDADMAQLDTVGLLMGLNLRARQLDRRANQTEKLISLGTLAAGLAHDLRNPLVSIQTFAALLNERGRDADFQQEFSAVVQRDVKRIAGIVENVAALAGNNQIKRGPVNLAQLLSSATEILASDLRHNQIELVLPAKNAPLVIGNYSQLLQVFVNLLQNAIQAMEGRSGSRLIVGFEGKNGPAHPWVMVTLADNGPGIDAGILPHLFEPFATTKAADERPGNPGMGLGLAIVKRIVQHHRGTIEVASSPGGGATFLVSLPAAPGP